MPVAWACNFMHWYMNDLRFSFLFCLRKAISKAAACALVLLGEKHLRNSLQILDQPRLGSILWSTSSTGPLAQHIATSRLLHFPTLQSFATAQAMAQTCPDPLHHIMGMVLNILSNSL